MTEGNDVKHSWIGLNSYFSASPKHALTFLIVGDSSRCVRFIANLGNCPGLDAIFNKGVYTWVLKIVTDGQTDSLTNLIKCMVGYRFYSYAFWSMWLWTPDMYIYIIIYIYIYHDEATLQKLLQCYKCDIVHSVHIYPFDVWYMHCGLLTPL